MMFSMDREVKQNLLNMYKQEANDYRNKKVEEKNKRIQEEREYIEERKKKDMEYEKKLLSEKLRRQNEAREMYKRIFNDPNRGKRKSLIREDDFANIQNKNNYGLMRNNSTTCCESNDLVNLYNSKIQRATSPTQKEKLMIRREDHMNNYLTDRVNEKELKNYFINERQHQQQFYKEILDSQVQQIMQKNMNSSNPIFHSNNVNIVRYHRRFDLPQDPYNLNRNSDFGKSNLPHNPITNPSNYLGYNKYLSAAMSGLENKGKSNYINTMPIQKNNMNNSYSNNYQNNERNVYNGSNYNTNNNYQMKNQLEPQIQNSNFNYQSGHINSMDQNNNSDYPNINMNPQNNKNNNYQMNEQLPMNQENQNTQSMAMNQNNYQNEYKDCRMEQQNNENEDNYQMNQYSNSRNNYGNNNLNSQMNNTYNFRENNNQDNFNNYPNNNYPGQQDNLNTNLNRNLTPMNQYQRCYDYPPPSGQTLRQAAANFLN